MAEHMNVGVGPPTSLVGRDDSAPCDPLLDRTVIGCDVAHEDRAARGCWTFMLQIARDRASGRGRYRQHIDLMDLRPHAETGALQHGALIEQQLDPIEAYYPEKLAEGRV